jgi:hypothetical protein
MPQRMLMALPVFSMWNEHGKIKFHKPVGADGIDLTEVDLARDVVIEAGSAEVYGHSEYGEEGSSGGGGGTLVKPLYGKKLNVPATITLNYCPPRRGMSPAAYEERLRKMLSAQTVSNHTEADPRGTTKFISYDQGSYEWVFRVPHFTKWGVLDEEPSDVVASSFTDKKQSDLQQISTGTDLRKQVGVRGMK